jgi:SagB-type dehydrogenase family enzyme
VTDAPTPIVHAALRGFSHELRGPGGADGAEPLDLAEEFHLACKVTAAFPGQSLGPAGRFLATTEGAPFALGRKALAHVGPRITLPAPQPVPCELRAVGYARRSRLPARCGRLDRQLVGTVLGLSGGASPDRPELRVTPSGGAMYPLDVFAIAHAVDGLAPGAYLYDPLAHALLPRGEVDPATFHELASAAGPMPQPALTLAVVGTFARSRTKYGLRGYRFTLLEAGHLVQAAVTVATALGLCSLPWGGFIDAAVDGQLELDGLDRGCVYLLALSAGDGVPHGAESDDADGAA